MNFLKALALGHQKHEGFYPGSLSWRNSNPGNLRLTSYQRAAFGATAGAGGFARFPSYAAGFQALVSDIRAKLTGHSAHIDYARKPTFLDYVKVYAPREDGNDPHGYAQALVRDLKEFGVRLDTPLSELARLAVEGESAPRPSFTFPSNPRDPKLILRRIRRMGEPDRSRALARYVRQYGPIS